MNTYRSESSAHRAAFGLAAVAMTALCFALAVVVPANHEPDRASAPAVLATKPASQGPIEVSITPAYVEVVGRRVHETAMEAAPQPLPKS